MSVYCININIVYTVQTIYTMLTYCIYCINCININIGCHWEGEQVGGGREGSPLCGCPFVRCGSGSGFVSGLPGEELGFVGQKFI